MVNVNKNFRHVLATGGDGYVGRHLQTLLPGCQVLDRKRGEALSSFQPGENRWREIEYVIHLADLRLQDINARNIAANIKQHREFIAQASELPNLRKFIFSSSCSVYGYSDEEITDDSVTFPTSHYAESKVRVEEVLKDIQLPHQIFRFGTAYGWSPQLREDLFINQLAKAAACGENMEIFSVDAWRPYIHCRDFAHVLAQSFEVDSKIPQNIVTDNFTKRQLLELPLFKNSSLKYHEVADQDPRNYRVKIHKERLPQHTPLEEGVKEIYQSFSHA